MKHQLVINWLASRKSCFSGWKWSTTETTFKDASFLHILTTLFILSQCGVSKRLHLAWNRQDISFANHSKWTAGNSSKKHVIRAEKSQTSYIQAEDSKLIVSAAIPPHFRPLIMLCWTRQALKKLKATKKSSQFTQNAEYNSDSEVLTINQYAFHTVNFIS